MNTHLWRYACLLCLGITASGCVYPSTKYDGMATRVKRTKPAKYRVARVSTVAPVIPEKRSLGPQWPRLRRSFSGESTTEMFARYGQNVLQIGSFYHERAHYLRHQCDQPGADPQVCSIFWRSQKIFAINYNTRRNYYRGYVTFNRRRKRRIPRSLMRWYKKLNGQKYRKSDGQCFLEHGILSNCMSFSMCAQKAALKRFQGNWGDGFDAPTWGNINYWSSRSYYRHYYDYRRQGQRRPGVRTLLQNSSRWSRAKLKRKARVLLQDMMGGYLREVRRHTRSRWSRRIHEKTFCSNIVAGMGDFRRALPGDMFAYAYLRKRGRRRRSSIHFQHWGLIVNPLSGKVLHNQTPGGMWGKQYHRWGIQYGYYRGRDFRGRWRWNRRRRRYSKRIFFVNRVNVHFYQFARSQGADIFDTQRHRSVCRNWIDRYAHLYFIDGVDPLPPQRSNNPLLGLMPPTQSWTNSAQTFLTDIPGQ